MLINYCFMKNIHSTQRSWSQFNIKHRKHQQHVQCQKLRFKTCFMFVFGLKTESLLLLWKYDQSFVLMPTGNPQFLSCRIEPLWASSSAQTVPAMENHTRSSCRWRIKINPSERENRFSEEPVNPFNVTLIHPVKGRESSAVTVCSLQLLCSEHSQTQTAASSSTVVPL